MWVKFCHYSAVSERKKNQQLSRTRTHLSEESRPDSCKKTFSSIVWERMFSKREEPHAPNDIAEETGNGELNCVERTDIQEDSVALLVGLPSAKLILDNSLGPSCTCTCGANWIVYREISREGISRVMWPRASLRHHLICWFREQTGAGMNFYFSEVFFSSKTCTHQSCRCTLLLLTLVFL